VCGNGFGKRTALSEYRSQGRGGKGVIDIQTSDRNGPVVAVAKVMDNDEVMITTTRGNLIRTRMADLRLIGRNTQGVRLIRLDEGDLVGSLAKLPEDELAAEAAALPDSPPMDGASLAGDGHAVEHIIDDKVGEAEASDHIDANGEPES
jgi:DNA gyrase subunit A